MKKPIAPKTRKENKLPDMAEAEKWLDPDTFVYKGKVYSVNIKGGITLIPNSQA